MDLITDTVDNHCGFWQSSGIISQSSIARGNGCNFKIQPAFLWLLADTKECINSSTILMRLHSFIVVCPGLLHTQGRGKQTWGHGGPRWSCSSRSPLLWRPPGTTLESYRMLGTHILPLGTLGLKGRKYLNAYVCFTVLSSKGREID